MLHYLTGATIQIANLVNYNCHPQVDGNQLVILPTFLSSANLFSKLTFSKPLSRMPAVSNSFGSRIRPDILSSLTWSKLFAKDSTDYI